MGEISATMVIKKGIRRKYDPINYDNYRFQTERKKKIKNSINIGKNCDD